MSVAVGVCVCVCMCVNMCVGGGGGVIPQKTYLLAQSHFFYFSSEAEVPYPLCVNAAEGRLAVVNVFLGLSAENQKKLPFYQDK